MEMYKKTFNIKHLFFSFVLVLLVYFFIIILLSQKLVVLDSIVLTFLINITLFMLTIIIDRRTVSLNKIYGFFMLIFMGIAPLCNYVTGYFPWSFVLSPSDFLNSNLFLLAWSMLYIFSYIILLNKKSKPICLKRNKDILVEKSVVFLFFVLSVFLFLFDLMNIGWSHFFVRGENYLTLDSPFAIVFDFVVRFTPVVTLFLLFISRKKKTFFEVVEILILCFITFVVNYPISNSRFNTAAVCFTILLAFLFKLNRKNSRIIDLTVILGIIVVFPIMSIFKRYSLTAVMETGISFDFVNSFNSIDFDAYSFIARGLKYTEQNGFAYGSQIISTIFFFVPRSILPIKGTNTGELIVLAQSINSYSNVSCPLMMELFIDFGWVGLLFGPLICSYLFYAFDRRKDYLINRELLSSPYLICYSLIFGFLIYVLRGSLAPTFLRLMGAELVVILLFIINSITKVISKRKKTINK